MIKHTLHKAKAKKSIYHIIASKFQSESEFP